MMSHQNRLQIGLAAPPFEGRVIQIMGSRSAPDAACPFSGGVKQMFSVAAARNEVGLAAAPAEFARS